MKRKIYVLFLGAFFACEAIYAQQKSIPPNRLIIPMGGNTWQIGNQVEEEKDIISEKGITKWIDPQNEFATFIRVAKKGTIDIWLTASVDGLSRLEVSIDDQKNHVNLNKNDGRDHYLGQWKVLDTGYVAVHLKANEQVALSNVASLTVAGTAIDTHTHFVKNNRDNFFYWGRRGP